jgi:hypothetical protein
MRRLARRLFTLCSAVSLVLFLSVSVLWLRGPSAAVSFISEQRDRWDVGISDSGVYVRSLSSWERGPVAASDIALMMFTGSRNSVLGVEMRRGSAAFAVRRAGEPPNHYFWDEFQTIFDPGRPRVSVRFLGIGYPTLAIATSALPALFLGRIARRQWRQRRNRPGRCRSCGYDLRATPARCPECGTAAGR